jgi:hypothetical protein
MRHSAFKPGVPGLSRHLVLIGFMHPSMRNVSPFLSALLPSPSVRSILPDILCL